MLTGVPPLTESVYTYCVPLSHTVLGPEMLADNGAGGGSGVGVGTGSLGGFAGATGGADGPLLPPLGVLGPWLPVVPEHCDQAFHMFYLLVPDGRRDAFIAHMKSRGVQTVFHYQPLHLSRMGSSLGGRAGQCPVTERVADELVRLPLYNDLSEDAQTSVIEAARSFAG